MRRNVIALIGLLWCCGHLYAGGVEGKTVLETWDAAYLGGGKAGYVQTRVLELQQGGRNIYHTTMKYRLLVKRFNKVIQLAMDIGSMETKEGKVVGVFTRQFLGEKKTLDLFGKVVGNQLQLTLDGKKPLKPAPWDDNVVGLYKQQSLFQDRKVKPGDTFSYRSFEPSINLVITSKVAVHDYENVELFNGKTKRKLLKAVVTPTPIQGVKLPPLTVWLDDNLEPARSEVQLPIGQLTLYRTSKADATKAGSVVSLTDIGLNQLIKIRRRITRPFSSKKAVFRITVDGQEDPAKAFSSDGRQSVAKVQGNTVELHVQAGPTAVMEKAPDEFIQSSYFINSEDPHVQKLANLAVGNESDPWKKALRIEKWVHTHMKGRDSEAMATADHVAKTLQGDCSEYAMLMAAMCRAQGIPSKTAMGLVYAEVPGTGPAFSFHMWTEVWIAGKWMPLDATLGNGYVGATHLKISDHSWHNTRTLTPVLPLYTLLGKLSIETVHVE